MNWGSEFSLESYKTADEAEKGKRYALYWLCGIVLIQAAAAIFVWWAASLGTGSTLEGLTTSVGINGLILLLAAALLYFVNSRIVAVLLLIGALISLATTWVTKVNITGDFGPPAMLLILSIAALQMVFAVFKSHAWQKQTGQRLQRPKWIGWLLGLALLATVSALLLPSLHFLMYSRSVEVIDYGDVIGYQYHDPIDHFGLDIPRSWNFASVPFKYGTVDMSPIANPNVKVRVERWEPWSVAAIALDKKEAFLQYFEKEAEKYAIENNATIDSVEMIGPREKRINAVQIKYLVSDGSTRYEYYYYNTTWSRQTSNSDFYFWRVTADIPSGAPHEEADFLTMIKTFRVDGVTIDSVDKTNIEQTRESFHYFLVAQEMPVDQLRIKVLTEVNSLLQSLAPDSSNLFTARADVSTYIQKVPDDSEVQGLMVRMETKYGACWGLPEGSCTK